MKVVENDSRCDDLPMIGTTTESLKSNFIINTFNEREKITEAEDGEDKFTSYLKEIIDKESRSLRGILHLHTFYKKAVYVAFTLRLRLRLRRLCR